jgi:hypothetical protein
MSNNQKAVKINPSDSKNVIQFALLRGDRKLMIMGVLAGLVGERSVLVDG